MTHPSFKLVNPNQAGAVITVLPNLCGVLVSFAGAYFIAITLTSGNALLEGTIDLGFFEVCDVVTKKIYIQMLLITSLILLVASAVFSVRTASLHYSQDTYPFSSVPASSMKVEWKKAQISSMVFSYGAFNFAILFLALSITALLDGYILLAISILLYSNIFFMIWRAVRDDSKSLIIKVLEQ